MLIDNSTGFEKGTARDCVVISVARDMLEVSLGNMVYGFISASDLSRESAKRNAARFKHGDKIRAAVVSVDDKGRVKLSVRKLEIMMAQAEAAKAAAEETEKSAQERIRQFNESEAAKEIKNREDAVLRAQEKVESDRLAAEAARKAEVELVRKTRKNILRLSVAATILGVAVFVVGARIITDLTKMNIIKNKNSVKKPFYMPMPRSMMDNYSKDLEVAGQTYDISTIIPNYPFSSVKRHEFINVSTNGGTLLFDGTSIVYMIKMGPNAITQFKLPGDAEPYSLVSRDSDVWKDMDVSFDEAFNGVMKPRDFANRPNAQR